MHGFLKIVKLQENVFILSSYFDLRYKAAIGFNNIETENCKRFVEKEMTKFDTSIDDNNYQGNLFIDYLFPQTEEHLQEHQIYNKEAVIDKQANIYNWRNQNKKRFLKMTKKNTSVCLQHQHRQKEFAQHPDILYRPNVLTSFLKT